jgi:hypothetical protein
MLKWETLEPNHDRKPAGELPPDATLSVFKLVRSPG